MFLPATWRCWHAFCYPDDFSMKGWPPNVGDCGKHTITSCVSVVQAPPHDDGTQQLRNNQSPVQIQVIVRSKLLN